MKDVSNEFKRRNPFYDNHVFTEEDIQKGKEDLCGSQ